MKSFFTTADWRCPGKKITRSAARLSLPSITLLVVSLGLSSCASSSDSFDLMLEQAGRQMFMMEPPLTGSETIRNADEAASYVKQEVSR